MESLQSVAQALTYTQRKALRRLRRGQSISRTQAKDPLIQKCCAHTLPVPPPDCDIVTFCDREAETRGTRSVLNDYGQQLLEQLETQTLLQLKATSES